MTDRVLHLAWGRVLNAQEIKDAFRNGAIQDLDGHRYHIKRDGIPDDAVVSAPERAWYFRAYDYRVISDEFEDGGDLVPWCEAIDAQA